MNGKTDKTSIHPDDFTVKELQVKLVNMGVDAEIVKGFVSKAAIIAVIEMKQASVEPETVASLEDKEDRNEKETVDNQYMSKVDRMRKRLQEQPTIRIKLPLEGQEKEGVVTTVGGLSDDQLRRLNLTKTPDNQDDTVHMSGAMRPVTINGYTVHVPKGVYVDVPEQVADVLDYSDRQQSQAGQNILLNRTDPETGRPVSESM